MDKISIESLFKCKTGNSKILDVKSITKSYHATDEYDVKKLIEIKDNRRKKLVEIHNNMYDRCIKKIHLANSLGRTDLLYTIPFLIRDLPEYNPLECLIYVENRLKSLCFDTYIVNKTTIFITWIYLEANLTIQ